jgi:DNA-binding response OmpR family regulator
MPELNADQSQKRREEHVRPHVLIVTSDADLRDFLQEGLLYGGFWVSVIASGVQTLEVFRLRSFDLVLIDGALAGFDAGELIRRLRRPDADDGPPRTDVPLLVIVDDAAGSSPLLAAGADEVLAPPIDLEALVPKLHEIVRDWRARHPNRPWADQLAQGRSE